MSLSVDIDTNQTMPTFGIDPVDFQQFVTSLFKLRQDTSDASKKRDVKADQKKRLQNRVSFQFAITDHPDSLNRLLTKLVSVDHDNKWLHQGNYLEFCLIDIGRIILKNIVLVTFSAQLTFSIARSYLKTLSGRFCDNVCKYMERHQQTATVHQQFDLRRCGTSVESMICETTKKVASDDRVVYGFLGYKSVNGPTSPQFLSSKTTGGFGKPGSFEGSCKVKQKVTTMFQYLCWRYAAKVMEFVGAGQDRAHSSKLRRWKRLQSHAVLCQVMAFSALESEKYNGGQDEHVLTPSNIKLKLITWQQDFRLLLSEHMHAEEDSIVHPHPIIGFQAANSGLSADELSRRQRAFDPWYHGMEYCLPALATMLQASRQIFLDDRYRKNTNGTTMLLGEAGSGKTKLLKAIANKFNGYLWQKKGSNFQSKAIETKSVTLVDEFDNQSLTKEQIHNEWKQRFDQEHSAYCDRKGVPGSNCTKNMPFFVTTNANLQWFRKNYDQALRRRILFIQFQRSHAQFENTIDVGRIEQRVTDTQEDECVLDDQIANTVLLLGLFRLDDSDKYFFTEPLISHLVVVVLQNIGSPLISVLADPELRKEFYDVIIKFTGTDQFISSLDQQGVYQQLYKPGNCAYRLLRLMAKANGVLNEELDFQLAVRALQKDPFRDLGQYLTTPSVSSQSDVFKLHKLSQQMPDTEIAKCFTSKVKDLVGTMESEVVDNQVKQMTEEEFQSIFKE